MIDLACKKTGVEFVKTGYEKLDDTNFCAFGRVTFYCDEFWFTSSSRTHKIFKLFESCCIASDCKGYVLSPFAVVAGLETNIKNTLFFEQIVEFQQIVDFIKDLDDKAMVLVLDFDYMFHNGRMINDTKQDMTYCVDMLEYIASKSKVAVIAESRNQSLTAQCNMKLISIYDEDYLLLDSGEAFNYKEISNEQ